VSKPEPAPGHKTARKPKPVQERKTVQELGLKLAPERQIAQEQETAQEQQQPELVEEIVPGQIREQTKAQE
jgi:hypothetical protein